MASVSALNEKRFHKNDAGDSHNQLDFLLGKSKIDRDYLVEKGYALSIIKGDWKYIEPNNGARYNKYVDIELGNDTISQLYNLKEDISEQNNLAISNPEKAEELAALLNEVKNN